MTSLQLTKILSLFSTALSFSQKPQAKAWVGVAVIALWGLMRFSQPIRSWLITSLKRAFWLTLEVLIVSWGFVNIISTFWRHTVVVANAFYTTYTVSTNKIDTRVIAILSFVVGVISAFAVVWARSGSSGSGAGNYSPSAKAKTRKPTDEPTACYTTVNVTANKPIDESIQTFFPNDIVDRISHLEVLLQGVLGKLSDIPSIDLIAASFQDVHDDITSKNIVSKSKESCNLPVIASIVSSLPEGNPLLLEKNDRHPTTEQQDERDSNVFQREDKSAPTSESNVAREPNDSCVKPTSETMTEAMLREYIGETKNNFFKKIAQLSREERESKRKPNELTPDEQQLGQVSLRDLDLKWIRDSFRQVKPAHLQDIGTLTPEESKFSRNSVREIIRQRRHENWVAHMKKKGIVLFICPQCNTTTTEGHRCFATAWNTKVKKGPLLSSKEILVTQQGRGAIKLQEQMRVDQEHLGKSYQKLHEKKHLLSAQENQAHALRLKLSSPSNLKEMASQDNHDTCMVGEAGLSLNNILLEPKQPSQSSCSEISLPSCVTCFKDKAVISLNRVTEVPFQRAHFSLAIPGC